jgi:phage gp45-like
MSTIFHANGQRLKIYEGGEIPEVKDTLYLKDS